MVQNKLIVGTGIYAREGWKTLDAQKRPHVDYVATIPPFPEAVKAIQWHEIEWVHGISSLYLWDAETAIKEIYRMLAPGGMLTLEQPDFRKTIVSIKWVFGDPEPQDPFHMNKWAYTPDSLSVLLTEAGFSRIDVLPARHHVPARDFRVEAYK